MIIGIDGNEANVENRVGVNTYVFNVLWGLYNLSNAKKSKNKYIIYLKSKPHSDLPKDTKNWSYKILNSNRFWIIRSLRPHLHKNSDKIDVFFTPSHYVPPIVDIPRVVAIMDLGYLEDTDQFRPYDYWQLKLWSDYSMGVSKSIIAISGQTERDIVRQDVNRATKTFITHLGFDSRQFNLDKDSKSILKTKSRYLIANEYLLFISTLKPSKNIEGLLNAWALIESDYKRTTLVIAGKKGWLFDSIFALTKNLKIEDRVIFTGFITERDKVNLIKGAKAFVLPSFWEGFGIDVLSSMASGVPVVVSNIGSLPEVAGKAGIYLNPHKVISIKKALQKVLDLNKKDYNSLVKLGLEQSSKFSWKKTAKQTLEIIEAIKK